MATRSDRRVIQRAGGHVLDWLYAAREEVAHALRPGSINALAAGSLNPVLLIPGVYETWEFMRPVGMRVNALGHPVHVVPGFGHNRGTIPQMAARAQRYLDTRDLRDVIVIAHSKGGLIGKHMMVSDDRTGRIARLIAINTPFGGSVYARFALRRTLREFAPSGVTLAALAGRSESNARTVSIYSEEDPVIPGGSELAGASNIRLPIVGHFRLLSSELLLTTVEALLRHDTGGGLRADRSGEASGREHDDVDEGGGDDQAEQQA